MKYLRPIFFLSLISLIISCEDDFLSPTPSSGITTESFFKNADEVESAVINLYDGLQGQNSTNNNDNRSVQLEFYITEMRSDNTRTKSSEGEAAQFESFNIVPENGIVNNYYSSFYNLVFRANVVLETLDVIEDQATAEQFEGEARFIRALAYFNLVRLWGDVPLVDRVISPLDTETQFTRVASSAVYDLIISDLTTAIDYLDNTYRTRASRAAAQALLAKVYLTNGNYTGAQALCEAVINSGFALEPNFNDVYYTEDNSETLFAVGYTQGLTSDSQNFSSEWLNAVGRTSGVNYVTDEARAALDDMGGDRTQYSYRQDLTQPTQYQVTKYLPNGEDGGADGKTFESDATLAGNDWIILRFGDVLLMHVEAIMAGGPDTSVPAALSSFQQIRDRAGLTTPVISITKQELLDERRVELAFENQRWFDLIRFGVAETVLSQYSADNGYGFTSTDLLLPFPQREVNISKGLLEQNPGY